jgi:hypothetical protein
MSTKHTLGGMLTGFFGSSIMRGIGSQLLGEVTSKVSEEAKLKIQKGGKGFADEVLFALVSLGELNANELIKLDEFLFYLWEDDKENNTENLKKLILFIATSAQEFTTEKDPDAGSKSKRNKSKKKASEKKVRDTKTGGIFLKALVTKNGHKEMIDFCRTYHVFDAPTEGYLRLTKKVFEAAITRINLKENNSSLLSFSERALASAREKFEQSKTTTS